MKKHEFGGDWTQDKLERIRKYLPAYTTIFTKNPKARLLTTTYVDAFAGTGYMHPDGKKGEPQFEFPELTESDNQGFLKGSARIALEAEPPFDHYLFLEQDHKYALELETLRNSFPAKKGRIQIIQADANQYLQKWIRRVDWNRNRAVVFLDPYGMEVEWALIQVLAATKAIDLWILFPIGVAVNRILTRDAPPEGSWADALTRFFGTDTWKDAFYQPDPQPSLFGDEDLQVKNADFKKIGAYFVARLKTVFPYVAKHPLSLFNSKNNPLYLLCFAAGNPKGGKTALKIARPRPKRV